VELAVFFFRALMSPTAAAIWFKNLPDRPRQNPLKKSRINIRPFTRQKLDVIRLCRHRHKHEQTSTPP